MKKIRLLEEEKRSLTQSINTEAARCFDERTKTYNRIEELKKKLLSAIKDIEQFDSSKDDSITQSVEKVTGNHLKVDINIFYQILNYFLFHPVARTERERNVESELSTLHTQLAVMTLLTDFFQ